MPRLPSATSCHVCCSPPPAHRSVLGTDCDQYSALGEGGSAAASAGPALRQMSFCANSVNVDWWWVSERGGSRRRAAIGRRKTKRTVSRLATRHSPTAFTRHMTTSRATRASSGSSASACRLNTIAAHATTCRQEQAWLPQLCAPPLLGAVLLHHHAAAAAVPTHQAAVVQHDLFTAPALNRQRCQLGFAAHTFRDFNLGRFVKPGRGQCALPARLATWRPPTGERHRQSGTARARAKAPEIRFTTGTHQPAVASVAPHEMSRDPDSQGVCRLRRFGRERLRRHVPDRNDAPRLPQPQPSRLTAEWRVWGQRFRSSTASRLIVGQSSSL